MFRCECNDRGYPSQSALSQHRKTKQHKAWVERNELRLLKIELTDKTNQIVALGKQSSILKRLEHIVIEKTLCRKQLMFWNGLSLKQTYYDMTINNVLSSFFYPHHFL